MTIYVVVKYSNTDFNIYAKSHSDKSKMVAYYEEQKARHTSSTVILTTKDNAKAMKTVWHNAHTNYGRTLTRYNKVKSIMGHDAEYDNNYKRRLRRIYADKV